MVVVHIILWGIIQYLTKQHNAQQNNRPAQQQQYNIKTDRDGGNNDDKSNI